MLSDESLVILILCSHLGSKNDASLKPLSLREWNALDIKIRSSKFNTPGELLGQDTQEIKRQLELSESEGDRIGSLLARREDLSVELANYASRGIHVITRSDPEYPARYHQRLKQSAPLFLFYAGEYSMLGQPGIAVVGSRNVDETGQDCAAWIGNACGLSGLVLYSGGARGVDSLSMEAALQARGSVVGVLADTLDQEVRKLQQTGRFRAGDMCLASPYSPDAGFSVGAAMGRNRLIYCLADYAIVVASEAEKGGTWAGATEALKAGWIPIFILDHPGMPAGNQALLQKGGVSFPYPFPENFKQLPGWLAEHHKEANTPTEQLGFL